MYDPVANTWTKMAELNEERSHHHASVLLPDGSVYVGGGENNGSPSSHNKTYRIYRPPYMFWTSRPQITSSPSVIYYDTAFNVSYTGAGITKVRLIRLGAATHSYDQNTRMLDVNFNEVTEGTLRVAAPANGHVAPPGYYLLFVAQDRITGDGGAFPSEGKFVRLEVAP